MKCSIIGCAHEAFEEGVCLWHYPLWEHWGYECNGYMFYEIHGQEEGRKKFDRWLEELRSQEIVDILTWTDWGLIQGILDSYHSLGETANE